MTLHTAARAWSSLWLLALLAAGAGVRAEEPPPHPHEPSASRGEPPANTAGAAIADVWVQTGDGRSLRIYSDLLKGRVTAVNFIFTNCTTICPLMGVRFVQLQPLLREQRDDVALLSVSIDPANDTPERLAAWGRRVGAQPGWTLVTGPPPDIDELLRSLGTAVADPAAHTPLVVIVDGRGAAPVLRRLDGLTDPQTLARILGEAAR